MFRHADVTNQMMQNTPRSPRAAKRTTMTTPASSVVGGGRTSRSVVGVLIAVSSVATMMPSSARAATSSRVAARAAVCSMPGTGYGQMFPKLPAATWSDTAIASMSDAMIKAAEEPTPEGTPDAEDNMVISAGWTYFGQFVDHDLTADDRPNDLTTPTKPSQLVNGRTPQLDLDSLYGSGPSVSTTLYEADGAHLMQGSVLTGSSDAGSRDLPRKTNGMAIIGDGRNDENRMVAGIHSMFIRLHNQRVDAQKALHPSWTSAQLFAAARADVVEAYQNVVLREFLPTIAGKATVDSVVSERSGRWTTSLRFYNPCQQMPVEFSVAAYRYGHSQVRGLYRINDSTNRLPVFSGTFGTPGIDLVGFSPAPSTFAIDWKHFLNAPGANTAQSSYKLDASLTNSLSLLPLPVTTAGPANLAKRNLLRSRQLGLPSGQAVAKAMGVKPLRDDQILIGAATGDVADARSAISVSSEFANNTPLWAYVLAESVATAYPVRDGKIVGPQRAPMHLGPVGGRIVTETIVGLLKSDPASIINKTPAPLPRGVRPVAPARLRELFDRIARVSAAPGVLGAAVKAASVPAPASGRVVAAKPPLTGVKPAVKPAVKPGVRP